MPEENSIIVEESTEDVKEPANIGSFKLFDNQTKLIASSIIIGSLLISASIFYNAALIIHSLPKSAVLGAQTKANPEVQDAPSVVTVSARSDEAVLGNQNAKVTVVEFADFQCPYCKKFFQETFPQIKQKYIDTGKIKYVYRHFPLSQIHAQAEIAAVAAECSNQQNEFWQYHDLLFQSGQSDGSGLAVEDLKKYADTLGLNQGILGFGKNKFNTCVDSKSTLATVQGDFSEGVKAGVSGTPTFFVNGKKLVGALPFNQFEAAIEEALK